MWFRNPADVRFEGGAGAPPVGREAARHVASPEAGDHRRDARATHPDHRRDARATAFHTLDASWAVRHPRVSRLAIMLGCVLAVVMAAWVTLRGEERGMRLVVVAGLTAPMLLLALRHSPMAIPYLMAIYAGNRGLRRVLDFVDGHYHDKTVIVLLPLLAPLCLGVAFAMRYHLLPRSLRWMFIAYFAAVGWGFLMGAGNGTAAAFELANYVGPALVLGYVLTSMPSADVARKWVAWTVGMAAVVAVYGWYQFLTMPPWDELWMRWALMISIGPWEPMQLRVFSTLASPGPAALFLSLGLLAGVAHWKRWGAVSLPVALLVLSVLLLTRVRATWLMFVMGVVVFAATAPKSRRMRSVIAVLVLAVVAAGVGSYVLPLLPGGSRITDRFQTMGDVSEDHSYQQRLDFSVQMAREVLARPMGHGLGESGVAVKAASGGDDLQVFDNGLINLGYALGLPGLVLLGFAAWTLGRWLRLSAREAEASGDEEAMRHVRLAIAVYVSSLLALAASNWVREDLAGVLWMLVGLGVLPALRGGGLLAAAYAFAGFRVRAYIGKGGGAVTHTSTQSNSTDVRRQPMRLAPTLRGPAHAQPAAAEEVTANLLNQPLPAWRRLRVAVLAEQFPRLSETFVLEQAAGLERRGHRVSVFSFHEPGEQDRHPAAAEMGLDRRVRCFEMPASWAARAASAPGRAVAVARGGGSPRACIEARRFGQEVWSLRLLYAAANLVRQTPEPFDVIHCHFGNLGAVGVALRDLGLLRGPIITSFHGRDVTRYPSTRQGVYDTLFRMGDRFLVNSGFTADKITALGCDPQRIDKVPVAFDTNKIPFRPRTLCPGEAVRLISVGRLVEKKGHEFAIRALAMLRDHTIRVELDIIGGGPLRGELDKLIQELGVADRVTLLGPQPPERVREAYDLAHLFLVPSVTDRHGDHEGQGLVLQEAQASGLPVIATDHNGFPEGMIDGTTGFLVPERDPAAIAQRLRWLIEHHARWPQIGRAGSDFVRRTYDRRYQNDRLEQVFLRLASQRSTASHNPHDPPRP